MRCKYDWRPVMRMRTKSVLNLSNLFMLCFSGRGCRQHMLHEWNYHSYQACVFISHIYLANAIREARKLAVRQYLQARKLPDVLLAVAVAATGNHCNVDVPETPTRQDQHVTWTPMHHNAICTTYYSTTYYCEQKHKHNNIINIVNKSRLKEHKKR